MYREEALPGKGCGVVAARDIRPGELIISETPLLVLPWWVRHSMFPGREKKDFLDRAMKDLTSDQRKQFFSLHDSKVGEGEEKTVDGIWRTNNFALGQSGARSDNGLFLRISRFNHSCVPAAEFVWNAAKRVQEIRAVTSIRRGAEITICYFTRLMAVRPQRERRAALLEQYGFLCDCPACRLAGPAAARDDASRRLVQQLDQSIERLLYDFPEDSGEAGGDIQLEDVPEPPVPVPGLESLDSEGGDLRDVVTAVKLLFSKLHLMDCLGFKVVSQLGVVSYLLEVCEEWELGPAAKLAADTGLALSARIHGREGGQYAEWARRAERA